MAKKKPAFIGPAGEYSKKDLSHVLYPSVSGWCISIR